MAKRNRSRIRSVRSSAIGSRPNSVEHACARWGVVSSKACREPDRLDLPERSWRWQATSFTMRWPNPPGRSWDGSRSPGATLLLFAEQGLGDTIQFVRYAPIAASLVGRVICACPSYLLRLVSTVRGIDEVVDSAA